MQFWYSEYTFLLVGKDTHWVRNISCDSLGIKPFVTTGRDVVPSNHMGSE